MNHRDKFLALAAVVFAIPLVAGLAPDIAVLMVILLIAGLYAAWRRIRPR